MVIKKTAPKTEKIEEPPKVAYSYAVRFRDGREKRGEELAGTHKEAEKIVSGKNPEYSCFQIKRKGQTVEETKRFDEQRAAEQEGIKTKKAEEKAKAAEQVAKAKLKA